MFSQVVCPDETPQGTTQPQVVGYLKFKKKTPKYLANKDGGVFKKFEKKIKKLPRNLELQDIIRTQFFVTFEGTLQLEVVLFQKHLKK